MRQATIVAEMADGGCVVEHVAAFEEFTALVLGFRRDPDVRRLSWHRTPAPAAEELREAGVWPARALPADVA
jgi:hypothetical protein